MLPKICDTEAVKMRKNLFFLLAAGFLFFAFNAYADVFLGDWKLALLPNGSVAGENDPSYSVSISKSDGYYIVEVKVSGAELDRFAESGNIKDPEYRDGLQMQEFMRRQEAEPDRYARAVQNNTNYQKLRIKSEQYSGKYTANAGVITKIDNSVTIRYDEGGKTLFLDRMGYFSAGKAVLDNNAEKEDSAINRDMAGKWAGTYTQSGGSAAVEFTAAISASGKKFSGFMTDGNETARIQDGFIGTDGNAEFKKVYDNPLEDNILFHGEFKDAGNTVQGHFKSLSDSKISHVSGGFTMSRVTETAEVKVTGEEKQAPQVKEAGEAKESGSGAEDDQARSKAKNGTLLDNMEEETLAGGAVKYKSGCYLENPITTTVILDTITAWTKDNNEKPGAPDYKNGTMTWKQTLEDSTVISTKITVNTVGKHHDLFLETTVKGAAKLEKNDVAAEYEKIVRVLEEERAGE
jgi:hypothetical protein